MLVLAMPEIDHINRQLNRILSYLENDVSTGRKGIVTEVADVKNDIIQLRQAFTNFIAEYRQTTAVKAAKISVWGMVGGAVGMFLIWVIKTLAAFVLTKI